MHILSYTVFGQDTTIFHFFVCIAYIDNHEVCCLYERDNHEEATAIAKCGLELRGRNCCVYFHDKDILEVTE